MFKRKKDWKKRAKIVCLRFRLVIRRFSFNMFELFTCIWNLCWSSFSFSQSLLCLSHSLLTFLSLSLRIHIKTQYSCIPNHRWTPYKSVANAHLNTSQNQFVVASWCMLPQYTGELFWFWFWDWLCVSFVGASDFWRGHEESQDQLNLVSLEIPMLILLLIKLMLFWTSWRPHLWKTHYF